MLNRNKVRQNSKKFLAAKTPLLIPQRIRMTECIAKSISLQTPYEDYKSLMKHLLDGDFEDSETQRRFKTISTETRNILWKLLFDDPQPPNSERQIKAGDLLEEYKSDACFFAPVDYNDWIVGLRDELLKREMYDFWHNVIVKKQLGLCWAKDCDFFDDMEDPEPAKFYRYAGAIPAWESEAKTQTSNATSAENFVMPSDSSKPTSARLPTADDLKINLEKPVENYRKLIDVFVVENSLPDELAENTYKAISDLAEKTIWSLLFDDPQPPTAERQTKAGDLLREHKSDAVFYAPWLYNEWIVKLRDEVLKRGFLDFWRNQIVKHELGLCWARDSDYFDDMDDPEPAKFYRRANCIEAWQKEQVQNRANEHKSGDQ